jgi:hypothetical protein
VTVTNPQMTVTLVRRMTGEVTLVGEMTREVTIMCISIGIKKSSLILVNFRLQTLCGLWRVWVFGLLLPTFTKISAVACEWS